jgi:hypothetical protein
MIYTFKKKSFISNNFIHDILQVTAQFILRRRGGFSGIILTSYS